MKPLIQVSPIVVGGSCRVEVGLFLAWASAWQAANPSKVLDLYLVPVKQTPAPVARNKCVKRAKERGVDYLLMLDDDMSPNIGFFEAALEFLVDHPGPAVIGVPYCTAPPLEDVTVFELTTKESGAPEQAIKMERIRREDAARCRGIERVVNMGTGCVMFDLRVFDKVKTPWFAYGYNEDQTEVLETEDCYFFRHLATAGLPLYCHWDFWSGHWKSKLVGKPHLIEQAQINEVYVREAEANLRHAAGRADKVPYTGQEVPPEVLAEPIPPGIMPTDPEKLKYLEDAMMPASYHMPRGAQENNGDCFRREPSGNRERSPGHPG